MAKIYKITNSKYFYATFADSDGSRKQISLKTTNKKEAEQILGEIQSRITRGRHGLPQRGNYIPLKEFVDQHLRYCSVNHAPATFELDDIVLTKHFLPFCETEGVRSLSQVSLALLEKFKIAERTAGTQPNSVNRQTQIIKAMLARAVREGTLTENPIKDLKPFKIEEREPRFLKKEEFQKLFEVVEKSPHSFKWKSIIGLTLVTGMRKGELQNLRWENVNFELGRIFVLNTMGHMTKNRKIRTIPLNRTALNILKEYEEKTGRKGEYVFGVKDGAKPFQHGHFDREFRKLVRDAGLKDAHFHSLRHSFGAHHAMNGTPLPVIQRLLGHSTSRMTERYVHVSESALAASVGNFELAEP